VCLRYSDLRICNQPFFISGGVEGIAFFGLRVIFFSLFRSTTLLLSKSVNSPINDQVFLIHPCSQPANP